MPPLPLRLAAEAPATEVLGPSFCLQAPDDEQGVCIIADSAGIAAVAVERPWPARELAAELGLPEAEAPRLQLVRHLRGPLLFQRNRPKRGPHPNSPTKQSSSDFGVPLPNWPTGSGEEPSQGRPAGPCATPSPGK